MMDFIYGLYQNDHFTLYLTIALIVLVVLFVVVLFCGKRDQKLEETRRMARIELENFKDEPKNEDKVVIWPPKEKEAPAVEETSAEKQEEEVNVYTFEPTAPTVEPVIEEPKPTVEEPIPEPTPSLVFTSDEEKPISLNDLPPLDQEDISVSKGLNELESIKEEFNKIELPEIEEEPKKVIKPAPQVFSSVFVNKEDELKVNHEEPPVEVKPASNAAFTIDDEEDTIELPSLKIEPKKEETPEKKEPLFNFDVESYDIK